MEIWKDIKGYENQYQVSNLGRVRSLDRIGKNGYSYKGKILKPRPNKRGYIKANLSGKIYAVHRLVAQAFIPNPNNYPVVNHKDENKQNNMIWINKDGSIDYEKSNLEWCTQEYNINYGTANKRRGESIGYDKDNPYSKSVLQYTKDGTFIRKWDSQAEAARQLGIGQGNISRCCIGTRNIAYGFIWKYAE